MAQVSLTVLAGGLTFVNAGIIAITPIQTAPDVVRPAVQLATALEDIVPPGTDPFDWPTVVQSVVAHGFSQVGNGVTDFAQGDFVQGLDSVVTGVDNILFAAPQDVLLGMVQSSLGQLPVFYELFQMLGEGPVLPPVFPITDLGGLFADLQWLVGAGLDGISDGATDLGAGATGLGLGEVIQGLNHLFVSFPQWLALGPLHIAFNALADPGDVLAGPTAILEAMQDAVNLGQTQIDSGVADLTAGNVIDALWNVNSGVSNLLVGIPQNALISMIDTLAGDLVLYPHFSPIIDNWPSLDLDGFLADLQSRFDNLAEAFSTGFERLAEGSLHMGVALLARGLDQLLVEIPSELILGPITLLLAEL